MRHAVVLAALALFAVAGSPAVAGEIDTSFKSIGDADAPVTIVEYASMSCPHCANFHTQRLPWLKETYIDTGKVRLEFRDFPLNAPALWGAMAAHCAGPERYFAFLDLLFRQQESWAFFEDAGERLKKLAKQAGMGSNEFDLCMANQSVQMAVLQSRQTGVSEHKVESTPSLVIDGETIAGVPSEADLARMIEAAGS
jgi:protein-disulfide isomerase